MKKRLLACLLTAAMLVSLFPLPALAAEAQRPEWMVTAFDPLDGDIAVQTVPQGGEPVLPDSLTAYAYVIEDDTAVIPPPEGLEQESDQSQTDGPVETEDNQLPVDGQEGPEDEQLPPDSTEEPPAPGEALTETMVENDPEPAEKQEPDIQPVTIPGVTWEAQPEFDPDAPGEYVYTPVLPAAYEVAGDVELPVISVTVTAAEQTALQRVQAMIDALPAPEDITPENRDEVEAQLAAIGEVWAELSDEDALQIDTARLEAVRDALAALDGQAGNELPAPLAGMVDGVEYWDENGSSHIQDGVNVVDSSTTTLSGGWYVVNSSVEILDRITVSGDVHLILVDGKTLTANSGINVGENQSLTIYGQSGGTGTLIATGISRAAGIGGNGQENTGSIVINGGTVTATGGSSGAGIGGSYMGAGGAVTINGGTINATGGSGGAGIGGGYKGERGTHDTVTINGGTVTAKAATSGSEQGAGIGAGSDDHGGDIIITGGIVTATGNDGGGAGIGAGYSVTVGSTRRPGSIGNITITGGIVNAAGGRSSAGIGYGSSCTAVGTITISGGTVTATGGNNVAGIQGRDESVFSTGQSGSALILASSISDKFSRDDWSGIIFEGNAGQLYGNPTLNADAAIPNGKTLTIPENSVLTIGSGKTLTNDGTIGAYGEISGSLTNNGTIIVGPDGSVPSSSGGSVIPFPGDEKYLDANGASQNIPATGTKLLLPEMTVLSNGWYVVRVNVTLLERLTVTGNVHLILMNGCKLEAQKGITVNGSDSLTIYAQSNDEAQMGALTVTSSDSNNAGIGGSNGDGGAITINGGKITAAVQYHNIYGSAGIGGGHGGAGGAITINNGIVNATGGNFSAGIGGGRGGAGGTIKINGGTVTATGGNDGAGIGGGNGGAGGSFTTGQNGNAFIIASSISDNDNTTGWSGVIFQGNEGKVYGTPALEMDATIPGDKTLEIPAGTTLTIDSGVTLTNNGEITNNGTLTINNPGKLANNGTLVNNSSITGNGTIEGGGELTNNGTIANGITVDLPTAPTITVQPQAKTVSVGETAEFTVTASGNPAPTYQWQVSKEKQWEDIPGAESSSYTTEAASMSMSGWQYRCVATNDKGKATSDPATLTVQKGVPPTAASQHLNIANHLAKTYTYLLSNLRPKLPEGASWENVTYELTSVNFTEAGYYTAGTAEIIHGLSQTLNTLSLPILFNDVTTEGTVGTITVTIRSDNYQDFTNTLEIIASNKEAVTFSGVTGVTVPYTGQPVKGYTGELIIQDSDGNPVTLTPEISYTGRLETSYKGTQPPTEVGTYSVIFRVADTDPNYIGRLAVNFEITKAQGGGGDPVNPGGGNGGGGTYTPPTYKPDVSKPSEGGGTPTVTPSNPKPGDTVTVKPRPDDGYEVDTITVTDKNGKPVEVTAKPDGTYTFKQPSGKVTIKVSYKPVDTPWNNPFADVSENDWYYEAVRFVQERGLMNGIGNDNFAPNAQLSRAQLAQILFNKEGRPGVNYLLTFPDVASEAWYTEAIRWAASQGIVGGYGDGTFGPNDPITREQLAVMLWRYSGSPAATNKELHFNDTDEISGFALEALRWAVENGILNGYGDGRLGPQGQATRAQVAQMLKNFIENQEEAT